jgi:iron complex outermembrane recepter protein
MTACDTRALGGRLGLIAAITTAGVASALALYAEYKFNEHLDVHGSILNVFDKPPPLDMQTYGSAGNYSNAFHDAGAIGRFFMVGLTYRL